MDFKRLFDTVFKAFQTKVVNGETVEYYRVGGFRTRIILTLKTE